MFVGFIRLVWCSYAEGKDKTAIPLVNEKKKFIGTYVFQKSVLQCQHSFVSVRKLAETYVNDSIVININFWNVKSVVCWRCWKFPNVLSLQTYNITRVLCKKLY